MKHKFMVMNTTFKKTKKTATFRPPGTHETQKMDIHTHEQVDYIATQQKWRNTILNAESQTKANISTGHYPVTATIKIKSKAQQKAKDRAEINTKTFPRRK